MIRLSKSVVGPLEQAAVADVIARGFLGTGSETQAFERELEAYIGEGASVACVSSGTAALQLALQSCGVGIGDEVLAPTLTFVASFQAISATGATPVPCDVDASTGCLDLADAARRITPRTRAIMPVHYAGVAPDLAGVYELAEQRHLRVVEDAAHAFGCTWRGQRVGSVGDVVCFSFDGVKNITSGEGGAVVSHDREVMRRVRDARLLGVAGDSEKRYQGARSWDFDVIEQGWRYHMSDIMAAIGRVQLRRLDPEFAPRRRALASKYRERLHACAGVSLFETDLSQVVPQIQPVRIPEGRRDRVRESLLEAGIQVGIHYKPNHLLTRFGGGATTLPVAERLYRQILTLPLHPDLTAEDVDNVVELIRRTR